MNSRAIRFKYLDLGLVTELHNEIDQKGSDGDFRIRAKGTLAVSWSPDNLIVAVKASATVAALQPIRHRIGPHTIICLFQNGMAQVEELNKRLFGIMYHGLRLRSPTEVILASPNGRAALSIVPSEEPSMSHAQPQFLLDNLLKAPVLQSQLLKLAANCIIDHFTAIHDVRNGCIEDNKELRPLRSAVLAEISRVFKKLPELQNLPCDQNSFPVSLLEAVVTDAVKKTAQNSSSIREDIWNSRETEIEYIIGWISRRGRDLGLDCVANDSITHLVLSQSGQGASNRS
ncbi:ketopantoate reductase PanE/ApbA C terminal-domain-containing protein [Aspergillus navahoensis]